MQKTNKLHPYSWYYVLPAFSLFGLFFILPNIAGMGLAFTDWNSYYPLKPEFNGLYNFLSIFDSSIFIIAVKNTLYFTMITLIVKVIIGFVLALMLNRASKLNNLYRTIIFAPVVINPLVVAIIFSSIYHPAGLLNLGLQTIGLEQFAQAWLVNPQTAMNAIVLMEIWMGIGISVVIFIAGLQSVPQEYYESARIDGANLWRQHLHITVPLMYHAITINIILSLVRGMSVFGQVYGLTNGGPADQTQVYGTFIFKEFSQNGLYGYSAAAGFIYTIAICIISFTLLNLFKRFEVER